MKRLSYARECVLNSCIDIVAYEWALIRKNDKFEDVEESSWYVGTRTKLARLGSGLGDHSIHHSESTQATLEFKFSVLWCLFLDIWKRKSWWWQFDRRLILFNANNLLVFNRQRATIMRQRTACHLAIFCEFNHQNPSWWDLKATKEGTRHKIFVREVVSLFSTSSVARGASLLV